MAKGGGGGRSAGRRTLSALEFAARNSIIGNPPGRPATFNDRRIARAAGRLISAGFRANQAGERARSQYLRGLTPAQRLNPIYNVRADRVQQRAARNYRRSSR